MAAYMISLVEATREQLAAYVATPACEHCRRPRCRRARLLQVLGLWVEEGPVRTGHDDLQTSKLRKRIRHEKQLGPSTAGDDMDQVIFDTRPPRFPPKLMAHESLFVPQEIRGSEEPLLGFLPLRRASLWEYYSKTYRRELGGSVVNCAQEPSPI
jgi:hypothetical protein